MEKELDLVELLKDTPKGTKLYSTIHGECWFNKIGNDPKYPIMVNISKDTVVSFSKDGRWNIDYQGDCTIFPSKENRDWSTFSLENESYKVGDHIFHLETKDTYFLTRKSQSRDGFWAKRINCYTDDCEVFIGNEDLCYYVGITNFNPRWLKEFDRVIIRVTTESIWYATRQRPPADHGGCRRQG